jgi:hypothetical protein
MRAYFPQNRMAVHDGQIQVEKHKIDLRRINMRPAPEQKIERIFTVGGYVEMVIGVDFLERIADQSDVGRVVLHQQNFKSRFIHCVTLPRCSIKYGQAM